MVREGSAHGDVLEDVMQRDRDAIFAHHELLPHGNLMMPTNRWIVSLLDLKKLSCPCSPYPTPSHESNTLVE
jgi:hypothetical protein